MQRAHSGMKGFAVVWIGQFISLLGTAMTTFALTLWAYETTGKATPLALIGFFFLLPMVVLGPFIGVVVDRSNRKLMLMVSDLAAAAITLIVLGLHAAGRLEMWHLYLTSFLAGAFQGFQWPACSVVVTLMLPKDQYARASGMLEMGSNASYVLGPLAAGALIGPLGLEGILVIDLLTAALAVAALTFVNIPQPAFPDGPKDPEEKWVQQILFGFRYIFARRSLLGLQTVFLGANFFSGLSFAVLAPMILARTGNDELVYGTVLSAGAFGGVIGGLAMGAWGGSRRRIHGVLLGWFCSGILGDLVLGIGRSASVWMIGAFLGVFFSPMINGCNQAIWQAKVPPHIQGRVFTVRQFIAFSVLPLASLAAGPLSDHVLEPAMAAGGFLEPLFGWLVGSGAGAGMALLCAVSGILAALTGLAGYLSPMIRHVESILPDHDHSPAGGL